MRLSRRAFLKSTAFGAIAKAELYWEGFVYLGRTQTGSPRLVKGEESRGSDHLDVAWDVVDGAVYSLRLDSVAGSVIKQHLKSPAHLDGLVPNRDYSISVAAADSTDWSEGLKTCTRPPIPGPLQAGVGDMTQTGVQARWDFTSAARIADHSTAITVALGHVDASGNIGIAKRLLPLSGGLFMLGFGTYVARLESSSPRVPNNENVSEWGPPSILQMVSFGLLRTPGRGLFLQHRLPGNITRLRT